MGSILSVLLVLASVCVQAVADPGIQLPPPYTASYTASYNGIPIKTVNALVATDNGYMLHTRAENFLGFIEEKETIGVNSSGGIFPYRYEYQRSLMGNKRSEITVFDRESFQAKNTYKKTTVSFGLDDNLLSPLSYQLQLRRDLMAGKKELHYRVIYRNKIRDYKFAILGSETLATAFGTIQTTKIQRLRESDDRETFLWLAESLDYLPVQLLQKEDGETYELQLASYEPTSNNKQRGDP